MKAHVSRIPKKSDKANDLWGRIGQWLDRSPEMKLHVRILLDHRANHRPVDWKPEKISRVANATWRFA